MGGISIWQLLIVAAIVLVIFGTKRLRNLGGDLGTSIKGFKDAMKDEPNHQKSVSAQEDDYIEGERSSKETTQSEHKKD